MKNLTPRIVVAGGGTGGHLFPALSVADELCRRRPQSTITFIGSLRGLEQRLVPAAGYALKTLRVSGLKGRGLPARALAVAGAAWAVLRCLGWLILDRPHVAIGVGGFASGPAILAASWLGVSTMVMEQNHFPGATNRWLSSRVDVVCVPSEQARRRLNGIGTVTGNPVRPEFTAIGEPPDQQALSLLVFGGSRGARSINRAMVESLSELARRPEPPRIVHQTGADDEAEVRRGYAGYPEDRYEVHAFLDDMPQRLAAADLVVCRAGATTLSELAAAGRPAILVPYPYAADDHQRHNAETVHSAGGAVVILDTELNGTILARHVGELADDSGRRREMAQATRALARPHATRDIADLAEALIDGRPTEGGQRVS